MLYLDKYRCAIFDCDGVILQSNEIKTDSFREALAGEPMELIDSFIDYHKKNGGISRYIKFEYYYKEMRRVSNYKGLAKAAVDRYAELVFRRLLNVSYVPGVLDVLKYFNNHMVGCYIISGGDELELCEVFEKRGISNQFAGIFGSPVGKKQHVKDLMDKNLLEFPAIFFGDSRSDMEAAHYGGLDFCFVSGSSEWDDGVEIASKSEHFIVENFFELSK